MPDKTIRIIDHDGTLLIEPLANYRAADKAAPNVSDSMESAVGYARANVPAPGVVWGIWPSGLGNWVMRRVALRDNPPKTVSE